MKKGCLLMWLLILRALLFVISRAAGALLSKMTRFIAPLLQQGKLRCGGLFHVARQRQRREMVASSPSADSLLIPIPLHQNLLQRVQCSWSDAQLDCAAILT